LEARRHNPNCSLGSVYELANPYNSVEVRGTAELIQDDSKKLSRELSRKYLGEDPPPESDDVVRLTVRVTPERSQTSRLELPRMRARSWAMQFASPRVAFDNRNLACGVLHRGAESIIVN
jgi:hypothetical protein